MASAARSDTRAAAVRGFNRFYTKQIGLLRNGYLQSTFSLSQVRVLYELAHREGLTATGLTKELDLDPGYLSRILQGFTKHGLLVRKLSDRDGRQTHLTLSARGKKVFAELDLKTQAEIEAMLARLSPGEQTRLIEAMHTIERLLGERAEPKTPYLLRAHQPGDMGWVIHRHGALYGHDYGWDERFEALVAEIAAKFIQNFDAKRERCWIAERDGAIVGSVFLVRESQKVARLRLLLVEPSARGLGIGNRLVEECTRFARQAGYKKITLWTQSILHAARHIYKKAGYRLVNQERHRKFGFDLVGETWDLSL
ncbi:MAG TPA: bifunctional helix-turn-helix transcriptional regulator/GNAT family N-acetyltransferase [Bryobacteraceae bacterium]|jgi:DNA-binding MarR family transcriptional regulator/N-acetylglutamate synthase-like GNAT family acetyltransferase|nr:bifunctional helix-turn-helix transcriptional regulator/GNAT family N-acetyltransferase [Bryobacteraceae bacterium]